MTSLPQTQLSFAVQDGRRRTSPIIPAAATSAMARARGRQVLPAVNPSQEFGCVDWFLYPDAATAEARAQRASA